MQLSDIVLQHGKSVIPHRRYVDTMVDGLDTPICLSNMPACQNREVLEIFNEMRWPYVYHRLGGVGDIIAFVQHINDQKWGLKSISIGVSPSDIKLLEIIKKNRLMLDWITIDVALIYNQHFEEFISRVRRMFPDVYLIAGNFCGFECANWLHNLGVNCGKHNIGVSELCRTRQYTGFGTTLEDFIDAANNSSIDLMFDGGLTILDESTGEIAYGDAFKAIGLGAKWIMSSSLFRWSHELSDHGVVSQYGNSTARAKGHNKNVEGAVKSFNSQYDLKDQMRKIKEYLQSGVSYSGLTTLNEARGYLL
jgi:GMP reductase